MGRHFSDWESVRVRVTNKNPWTPGVYSLVNVVLSRHSSEEEVAAADPRLQFVANHPVVYAAKGSHAHYPSVGKNYYERFKSVNLGVGTFAVDGFDLTADGGQQLNAYDPAKHIVVSPHGPGWQRPHRIGFSSAGSGESIC